MSGSDSFGSDTYLYKPKVTQKIRNVRLKREDLKNLLIIC